MWQTKITMSENEKALLNDLDDLIVGLVTAYEHWRDAIKRTPRPKKVVGTGNLFLALKQSRSIRVLVANDMTNSAMVLLRSLIETYLNCAYVLSCDDLSNMARFMYSGDKDTLENTKKYQKFVKETYTKPAYSDDDFDRLIKKYEDAIQETAEMGYQLKKMPDMRTRCTMIQNRTGCPDFGELYFNSYLFLCDYIHSSAANVAAVGMSVDFESRWYDSNELDKQKDTLTLTCAVLSSMVIFLENNANLKLTLGADLRKLIKKHNRYKEYPQLKKPA